MHIDVHRIESNVECLSFFLFYFFLLMISLNKQYKIHIKI